MSTPTYLPAPTFLPTLQSHYTPKAVCGKGIPHKRVDVFFKGKCFGCVMGFCAAFGLEKNDASQLLTSSCALDFHGAAKHAILYLHFCSLSSPDELLLHRISL